METEIIFSENLEKAAAFIRNGQPIAFPTETVYGLGSLVFDPDAIAKIFSIKGRPSDNPLIAHIANLDQPHLLSDALPDSFFHLAKLFWPGPLAIVVKRSPNVPSIVSAGQPTIAIRMPSHPIALQLIELSGGPLAAPSANLSGKPSPTTAQDVLEDLNGKIPLIIDGGACRFGIESTVISLVGETPLILRPGSISKEELEKALRQPIFFAGKEAPIHSPGMKYRHYAPKAKVRLLFDANQARGGYLLSKITASTLYAELRKADRIGVDNIEILCDEKVQSDAALMNRLLRASE